MKKVYTASEIFKIKFKLLTVLLAIVLSFYIYGEYLLTLFNPIYDSLGYDKVYRIRFIFRPLIMVFLTLIFSLIYISILIKLRPLFQYLTKQTSYKEARVAMIKIPNTILFYQVVIVSIGTLIFYAVSGWKTYSGFPFYFGLATKIALGLLSSMYAVFIISRLLKNIKQDLQITDIMDGENDRFSRYKDVITMVASSTFLASYMIYISYYFAVLGKKITLSGFSIHITPVIISMLIVSIIPLILSKIEFRYQIKSLLIKMQNISNGNIKNAEHLYLFNFDELGEMAIYVNQILDKMNNLLNEIFAIISHLSESSNSLASVSEQSSTSSNQQAAAISEIVSTMEDSSLLSKNIGIKSLEVLGMALSASEEVEIGGETINEHLTASDSVKKANEETIEFIKTLNSDIKTIWDVVTIINSIADQIKIIAFNAELEASSAEEAGKNFEIVASEIRRLADKTVSATSEIHSKISLIEKAGKALLNASKTATSLIEKGWRLSNDAGTVFDDIKKASKDMISSSKSIETNIRMQIDGFEQILLAMKQISDGAADFTESTAMTSKTASSLTTLVDTLKKMTMEKA